jgi:hypothetical protein
MHHAGVWPCVRASRISSYCTLHQGDMALEKDPIIFAQTITERLMATKAFQVNNAYNICFCNSKKRWAITNSS